MLEPLYKAWREHMACVNKCHCDTKARERRIIGETFRNDPMEATGNRAFHPEGQSKSLEASLAWVLATRFVKRRQRVQMPRN
jgi:hypothetical protein